MNSRELLKKFPIISEQINKPKLQVILEILERLIMAKIPGDVVELGCYKGTTSLFLQRLLKLTDKKLYLYDSFEGLPEKTSFDMSTAGEQFKPGELSVSKKMLTYEFKKANLDLPFIKKAWFKDLTPADMPKNICFGFLDGDFFDSISDSLKLCWPLVSNNGVLVVDDFSNEALPGASRACHSFFNQRSDYKFNTSAGLGIYIKK